jgi:catechol 2,3-dioxygenase-like lactoylglutathione lyase family enzyme
MSKPIDLDHIALAAEHAWDNFNRYRGDLGGEWIAGTPAPGFYWGQVRFANGMIVEMLEPANVELDDFLVRFLARSGAGPHHLTFKVPDIVATMDAATAAGYPPVRSDLSEENWKEAFLHPKTCHGIVVQIAQTPFADSSYEFPTPERASVLPPARWPSRPRSIELCISSPRSTARSACSATCSMAGSMPTTAMPAAAARWISPGPARAGSASWSPPTPNGATGSATAPAECTGSSSRSTTRPQ